MDIRYVTLPDAGRHGGVVVVVDVLRAFTVAATALAAGARAIHCVATVDEARAMRDADPQVLAMGEHHHGRRVPGFDFGNSPTELAGADLDGRVLVHRTSAGTQGLVRAAGRADTLFAASFACATATAQAVRALRPGGLTFVATGVDHRDGDEDLACADYIAALVLAGEPIDPEPFVARVATSDAARSFLTGNPDFPRTDVTAAMRVDSVGFAMRAEVHDDHPVLTAHHPGTAA